MDKNIEFDNMFDSRSKALKMGLRLRELILSFFLEIDESIIGGTKIKLALYSRGGKNNLLCGIQQGKNDSCMLYVHHVLEISHERLNLIGKGKHSKQIKFNNLDEINEKDINWLFGLIDEKAPF
ncbi:MAG: DUF1801 domain-containing protein [Flaviramulus sp.]|nr:hypothetical protein [Flaviramulus sp.]NNC50286.1 DUF1801 domain-containing protein [Flaviramulus sp.]